MTEPIMLLGLGSIAEASGLSRRGVREAIKKEGFPAVRTASGTWMSHREAINQWCLNMVINRKYDITKNTVNSK